MTAEQIKAGRERLGLSIAAYTRLLGVHRQTYLKWERGEQAASAAAVSLFSAVQHMHDCGCLESWR